MRAWLACMALALGMAAAAEAQTWSDWELENSVAREGAWLVIKQPGEGFCYLKQSHNRDASKMELMIDRSGAPALITPFFRGLRGNLTYQVDDRDPGLIDTSKLTSAASVELPRSLVPAMKVGSVLKVRAIPVGDSPRTQTFSLKGFTAASRWLTHQSCGFTSSKAATGAGGTTKLNVSLQRASGGKVQVVGEADVPDGMKLMIGLHNPQARYSAQDKVEVQRGRFESAAFSNRGAALPSGKYEVSISSPTPSLQPRSVRAVIGENGQNLSGPAVTNDEGRRRIDWTVERKVE